MSAMTDRRRNTLILLIVAGPASPHRSPRSRRKKTRLGLDLKGGVAARLPGASRPRSRKSTPNRSNRAIDIMRKRVDQLGVAQPEIQRSGSDEIDVALPDVSNATRAEAGGRQDRAAVLLRLGAERDRPERQAGADRRHGDGRRDEPGAGGATAGLPRVPGGPARRQTPADPAQERHDVDAGLHARQQTGECIYGSWYLLDTKHEKVLRGPEETEREPVRRQLQTAAPARRPRRCASTRAPCSSRPRPIESAAGKVTQKSRRTAGTC